MRLRSWFALAFVAAAPLRAVEPAAERLLLEKLRATVEARVARVDGIVGVFVEDIASGATIAIEPDRVVPAASVIKMPIVWDLFARADEGRLDLGTRLRLPEPRVGGGGTLEHLSREAELSLRDLALFMVTESDNDATNALIDHLGMAGVNARLDALGLARTRLRRRMMDVEAARAGRENVSTPREMAALMKRIQTGEGLSPRSAEEVRALLGHWPRVALGEREPFLERLPEGAPVLEKPGALDGVRTVAALVRLPRRPFVVTVFTTALARDADGDDLIADLAAAAYATFDRLGRMGEAGRVLE
jgi:beta-lactamase class A